MLLPKSKLKNIKTFDLIICKVCYYVEEEKRKKKEKRLRHIRRKNT